MKMNECGKQRKKRKSVDEFTQPSFSSSGLQPATKII